MDTAYYFIFGIGAVALVVFLYFTSWRKKPESTKQSISAPDSKEGDTETPLVDVRTYDVNTRTIYNETIPGATVDKIRKEHGNLGRKWLYEGCWRYALKKDLKGEYSPVIVPISMDNPPSRLHRALNHPQVAIVYNVEHAKNFLQKYGHIFLFAGVCAFLMFMLVAQ